MNSIRGLRAAVEATPCLRLSSKKRKGKIVCLRFVVLLAQVSAICALALNPLAVVYVLGVWISAGLSIWRLKVLHHHHYVSANGKDHKHLTPALTILYCLGAVQGFFSVLGQWDRVARPGLKKEMAGNYKLDVGLVSKYLDETVTGCMKDPSFARGRNLVTYAVDLLLMDSTPTYH